MTVQDDLGKRVGNFGAGLLHSLPLESLKHDVDPEAKNLVGIFLSNGPEWVITDYACVTYALVSIPIPSSADSPTIEQLVTHTGLTVVVTDTSHVGKLFDSKGACANLKQVVLVDVTTVPQQLTERAGALDITIWTMKDIERLGVEHPKDHTAPQPDDIFTISPTSDGTSKSVVLQHWAVAELESCTLSLPLYYWARKIAMYLTGCQVVFAERDNLYEELASLEPTALFTDGATLNRIHARIKSEISSAGVLQSLALKLAFWAKGSALHDGRVAKDTVWDSIGMRGLQAKLGGKLRLVVCDGSSSQGAVDPPTLNFFRTVLGCQVYETYGKPECSGAALCTSYGDYQYPFGAHIGLAISSAEVKLVDVPAKSHLAIDKPNPRGELCIRGPVLMKESYKEPKATAEVIDATGWFHTGDLAELLPNGTVKILGRV
ncbi:Long-chain-fatty-acid--CoA ligase 6 [Rhizophlyctis rosea]|nr:Long-chain-fatty-acid--CoA ligase 6 [Rhizophlyctis rosea]